MSDLTQMELARRLGVTRQRVSQVLKAGALSDSVLPAWLAAVEGCDGPVSDAVRNLSPIQVRRKPRQENAAKPKPVHDRRHVTMSLDRIAAAIGVSASRLRAPLQAGRDYDCSIQRMLNAAAEPGIAAIVAERVAAMRPTVELPTRGHRRVRRDGRWVKLLAEAESITVEAVYLWMVKRHVPHNRRERVAAWATEHGVDDPDLMAGLGLQPP